MNHCVIHIPHASKLIPDACRDQFSIGEKELNLEMVKLTDHFTDSMTEGLQAVKVVFPYSRLLVDVERFAEDDLEPMSQLGMGVIYENGHKLKKIRRTLTDDEKIKLFDLYWNYHKRLGKYVDAALQKFNQCLIIDLHGYPKLNCRTKEVKVHIRSFALGRTPSTHQKGWSMTFWLPATGFRLKLL